MRIEVYKDWVIRSDSNQFILAQTCGIRNKKDENKEKTDETYEVFKNETYHTSVESALKSLCRKEILACKATTFIGLQKEYEKLNKMIHDFSEQLTGGDYNE